MDNKVRTKAELKEDSERSYNELTKIESFDKKKFINSFYELDKILEHSYFGCRYFLPSLKIVKSGSETIQNDVLLGNFGSEGFYFCSVQGGLFNKKVFFLKLTFLDDLKGFKVREKEINIEMNNGDNLIFTIKSDLYHHTISRWLEDAMDDVKKAKEKASLSEKEYHKQQLSKTKELTDEVGYLRAPSYISNLDPEGICRVYEVWGMDTDYWGDDLNNLFIDEIFSPKERDPITGIWQTTAGFKTNVYREIISHICNDELRDDPINNPFIRIVNYFAKHREKNLKMSSGIFAQINNAACDYATDKYGKFDRKKYYEFIEKIEKEIYKNYKVLLLDYSDFKRFLDRA